MKALLGANMPLPDHMQSSSSKKIKTKELMNEFEKEIEKAEWDGIWDAFQPVRSLVQGKSALMDDDVYEDYRQITAKVLSRVSLINSKSPWVFFCLRSGNFGAPRWVLFPGYTGEAVTSLEQVCAGLRERLNDDVVDLEISVEAAEILNRFLKNLSSAEKSLLPMKC